MRTSLCVRCNDRIDKYQNAKHQEQQTIKLPSMRHHTIYFKEPSRATVAFSGSDKEARVLILGLLLTVLMLVMVVVLLWLEKSEESEKSGESRTYLPRR